MLHLQSFKRSPALWLATFHTAKYQGYMGPSAVGADAKLTQWRFHVTQRDDLEPVGGLGIAATKCGSVKSRRLGQICVGANSLTPPFLCYLPNNIPKI